MLSNIKKSEEIELCSNILKTIKNIIVNSSTEQMFVTRKKLETIIILKNYYETFTNRKSKRDFLQKRKKQGIRITYFYYSTVETKK